MNSAEFEKPLSASLYFQTLLLHRMSLSVSFCVCVCVCVCVYSSSLPKSQFDLRTILMFIIHFMSWRRKCQSTPALMPGKSHGRRSLIGYSPWGRKELDRTERLHFTLCPEGMYTHLSARKIML